MKILNLLMKNFTAVYHWKNGPARTMHHAWCPQRSCFIPEGKHTACRIDHDLHVEHSMVMVYLTYLHNTNHNLPVVHSTIMPCAIKKGGNPISPPWIPNCLPPSCIFFLPQPSPTPSCFIKVLGWSHNLRCRCSISTTNLALTTLFKIPTIIPSSGMTPVTLPC